MTLSNNSRTTFGTNEPRIENKDPFFATPPRKTNSYQTQTTTPATPKSKTKGTPLHKRFLEEVTMSPGTPPKTPSRSPKRGDPDTKQTLEVGQNGFYFSMEIPERKIVPSRAATPTMQSRAAAPDAKLSERLTPGRFTPGRLSPSPKKEIQSEVKGAGRVKDILRKNLFGTPTKKGLKKGLGGNEKGSDVRMTPTKDGGYQSRTGDGTGSGSTMNDAATKDVTTLSVTQGPDSSAQPSAQSSTSLAPPATQKSDMPPGQHETRTTLSLTPAPIAGAAPPLNLRKAPAASTPLNIGHLMANHSNKSSKVQTLPSASGMESMPTPLRKMSERLGLTSPHVVRKEKNNEDKTKDVATSDTGTIMSPISSSSVSNTATAKDRSVTSAQAGKVPATTSNVPSEGGNVVRKEHRLTQLLPSPITTSSPVISSRPSTATTSSYPSPLTPSRPGLSSRSKSFGTPASLRSSMKEDMFRVQESLKRSLGQEAFQKNASRPRTPMSPTVAASRPSTSATNHSRSNVKTATRPVSIVGPPKSNAASTTQAVPRRPLNTAARKPRPKSMIVGSAKMLETIASQIDSPRERAKLRSAAAAPSTQSNKPTVSRAGTVEPTSRGSKSAVTIQKPGKSQPTVRTTKSAALRAGAASKGAAHPTPTTISGPAKQRVVSAEAIADRVAKWHDEERQKPTPKLPVDSKSTKTASKPVVKQTRERFTKTPEPKDVQNESGPAQPCSYTPPGNPTRLPMSPSKKRLVAPTTPAPAANMNKAPPPSAAAQLRTPLPAKTPTNKRMTWVGALGSSDPNALRTPSKEIQSSLDAAIDRKIDEDRRRAGWL